MRNRCRVGLCWCSSKKGMACRNGDAVNGDHESHCRLPGRTSLCYYTNIAGLASGSYFSGKLNVLLCAMWKLGLLGISCRCPKPGY